MMNYTVPGGRFDIINLAFFDVYHPLSLHTFDLSCELAGKCNRGLMVVGSLRHLIKEREKVNGHHSLISRLIRLFNNNYNVL